jgi:hypothetical protein
VQINQTGTNYQPAYIHLLGVTWSLARGILAECGDFAVEDQQISLSVHTIGGVNDSSAGQQQRVHAARGYGWRIDKASAGGKIQPVRTRA